MSITVASVDYGGFSNTSLPSLHSTSASFNFTPLVKVSEVAGKVLKKTTKDCKL